MVLIDKGYYDYDYSEVAKKEERKIVTIEDTRMSDEEIASLWKRIRGAYKPAQSGEKKELGAGESGESRAGALQEPLGAGELQELVIKDLNEKRKG